MILPEPQRAYVGIGSNLDEPPKQLDAAIAALTAIPGSSDLRCSPRYWTPPVGDPSQPDFLNAVATFKTELSPLVLLDALQAIENEQGRVRDPQRRFGPRSLDLDLLLLGEVSFRDDRLELPHPRMHERAFVLRPLADLNPELEIPGYGSIERLLEKAVDANGLQRWSQN